MDVFRVSTLILIDSKERLLSLENVIQKPVQRAPCRQPIDGPCRLQETSLKNFAGLSKAFSLNNNDSFSP
jgi:hypothetical protein